MDHAAALLSASANSLDVIGLIDLLIKAKRGKSGVLTNHVTDAKRAASHHTVTHTLHLI